jgi:hypothetical protein
MPVVDLVPPEQVWVCPYCPVSLRTKGHGTRTPLHECAGKAGFRLPMLAQGERGDIRVIEREDYVGREDVQVDADGRPIMRAEVEHEDGHSDVYVYAPTARAEVRA